MDILLLSLADLGTSTGDSVTTIRLARSLVDEGHTVTVLAPQSKGGAPAIDPGGARISYHWTVQQIGLPNSLNTLVQFCKVVGYKRWRQVDVLYVRAAMLTFLFGMYFRLFGSVFIVSEHHGWTEEERANSGRLTWLASFERATQVLDARLAHKVRTVVPGIQKRLEANGVPLGRVVVVGNACDTDSIRPVERGEALMERGLDPRAIYLGFIGNLAPWQGVDTVLDALPVLAEKVPSVKLLIAGDGPEMQYLVSRVRQLDITGRVLFLGRVEHTQIHRVIGCFDLAVLPTQNRGYAHIGRSPLKLREYAAAGRPVLAARIPGVMDLGREQWLTMYQAGDAEDFALRAAELLGDLAALRDVGDKARQYAETHFSWPVITRCLMVELGLDVHDNAAIRSF